MSDRVAVGAVQRAEEAVGHALSDEFTRDAAGERVHAAWGATLQCVAAPEADPDEVAVSLAATQRAAEDLGGDAAGEALAALGNLGVRSRLDPRSPDALDDACAAMERMLHTSDVGVVNGLRWS